MKTMKNRTMGDKALPAAAAGSLLPYKISWLKMPQGSRKVEIIQLFPGHYRNYDHCGCPRFREKLFPYRLRWLRHAGGIPAAMVPAMPAVALQHLRLGGNKALKAKIG